MPAASAREHMAGDAVYANCTVGNVALCPRLQPSSRRYGDLLHLRHISYG